MFIEEIWVGDMGGGGVNVVECSYTSLPHIDQYHYLNGHINTQM